MGAAGSANYAGYDTPAQTPARTPHERELATVAVSQADYDALVASDDARPDVLYVIKPAA